MLLLGQTPTSKPLRHWLGRLPGRGIGIDPDGWLTDPTGCLDTLLAGDVAAVLDALGERLRARVAACHAAGGKAPDAAVETPWLRGWREAEQRARAVLDEHAAQGEWEGRVAHELSAALPAGTTLFVGSSMPIRDLNGFGAVRPLTVWSNRGCNGIDGGVATAAGIALASGGQRTVAWLGDLALLHDLDGLEAAGAGGWPLTVVVVNNRGGGIFDQLPIAQHPNAHERLFVTPRVARIGPLCAALGATHRRVALAQGGLPDALRSAAADGGLQVIEVRVERQQSADRRRRAWQAVDAAVRPQPQAQPGSGIRLREATSAVARNHPASADPRALGGRS